MELVDFFEPIDQKIWHGKKNRHPLVLAQCIDIFTDDSEFPDLQQTQLAILGVKEDRMAGENEGCGLAPDYVRKYLYELFQGSFKVNIADLGNIKAGNKVSDTYFALKTVLTELISRKVIPIIIGGSQDLTYANYLAYGELGQVINLISVDSAFDLGLNKDETINNSNYLSAILTHQPNFLFNYTNLGYQTYLVDQDAIELMGKLFFDVYRLGVVRKDLEEVEPVVRNADVLSFDVSSIRQSDAPGNSNVSPNGFQGEEACQIVRYAGLSDKLSSIGFYEANPALDRGEQTMQLVAQMIWYFIEGFSSRKKDMPDRQRKESGEYIKYFVSSKEVQQELVFYKSKKSDRWWMEVPCPASMQVKYERQFLVPCSYREYLAACQNDIPEKWLQVYRKFY
ncbi:MAG TPA: formimidoylglutamase [Bacteroidales bacterium]|nr:formimidoylglutamase [Bacteroidales bacterium]